MSYTRLVADDFVVSSDAISSTCWTNGNPTLSTFFTSSTQANGSSGNYYLNVYNTASNESSSAVQFGIAYGNAYGSGSANYNSAVNGKSPTGTIWGQWQDLVLGDENANFVFGAITSSEFFAVTMERACFKDALFLGSLTLKLSGSAGVITLTDNSQYVSTVQFCEAGRVYQLISGSAGTKITNTGTTSDGFSLNSGSYGWLLPDIGSILLNPLALKDTQANGGIGFTFSGSQSTGSATYTAALNANASLFRAMSGSTANVFTLNSQETITSDFIFVRPRSSEYNYSENPSFISGSTGEVLYPQFINNPQTYITTIGLYNDTNELLAVAKLSRPLTKDFTKEALVRVKLDF
jgi:hypothetical protein